MKRLNRPFAVKSIDEAGVFEGYGSVFWVEDSYKDVVLPGAFTKSLASWKGKGSLPPLLWQHRHDKPIGVYEEMFEDTHGLFVRGRLLVNDVALAKEAWALLRAGAIKGLSIGYRPVVEEYNHESNINNIKEIDLWETSLVTFPANESATVTSIKTVREFEKFLRDAGFSRSEAVRIASSGFGMDGQRDSDEMDAIKAALERNIQLIFSCGRGDEPAEIAAAGALRRPDGWEHMADPNWDYNVGLAGKLRHEDVLGRKIASLPRDFAAVLLEKLKGNMAPANDAKFSEWITRLLSDDNRTAGGKLRTTGEMHTLWFIEPDIAEKLKTNAASPKIELSSSLITITDRQALHILHLEDLRSGAGRPPERIIAVEDLKRMPRHLREPQAVLYDTSPPSRGLVYVFAVDAADSKGKWAVRINLQDKRSGLVTNSVRTGAYVDAVQLAGKQYILLKGSL